MKENLKNLGIGVMATVGVVGMQDKDANGNTLKHTDKIENKTEQVVEKKDSTIHNIEGDQGFKYPFDSIYKTDAKFYRTVAYGQSMDQNIASKIASLNANSKLLNETGKRIATMNNTRIIEDKTFIISLPKKEAEIGKPLSPYAVTKFVNELYADVFAKQYGMNITGLRYFNVFGPKQDPNGMYAAVIPLFIKSALHNEAPKIYGDGLQTRDFTYVQNVVKANLLAL